MMINRLIHSLKALGVIIVPRIKMHLLLCLAQTLTTIPVITTTITMLVIVALGPLVIGITSPTMGRLVLEV